MIFQASVELDVEGRDVHAIFDMDTGMMGFTEIFEIAFAKLMESIAGKNHQSNSLICRKGKAAQILQDFWVSSNASIS